MSELLIYSTDDKDVNVRLEGDTVWLTQEQMATLFERDRSVINRHLRNVYKEGELEREATRAFFAQVQTEGERSVTRQVEHYNLDAIISVGYRVNSRRGVQFRQWATRTLRDHLTQGYSLNHARLAERGIEELQQAMELLTRTLQNQALISDTGRDVLELITGYAKTWRLLLDYDEDKLAAPAGCQPARGVLDYATASAAIAELKSALLARGEATALFGRERGDALAALLGNIEQSMFGESLYQSREEKAAHLLYFVIKNHPFTDGNKRIGSFLFMLYLRQEGIADAITDNTLTALALLVAESNPANKNLMIRLVLNLLASGNPHS